MMTPQERGRLGGRATVEKYGKEHMSKIGQAGFTALVNRTGNTYAAVRFLSTGRWSYMDGKKVGGNHYAAYHSRGK